MNVVWTNIPIIGAESVCNAIVVDNTGIREVGGNVWTTDRAEESFDPQVTVVPYRNLGRTRNPQLRLSV